MSERDNFSPNTKEIIAKRAGFLCSFPGCGNITISAGEEHDTDTNSTGMACHISAAASGKNAKRFDPDMLSEERSHVNNGIWMCYKHGKIIDTDETRFTTEILKHWKKLGEDVSRLMHEQGLEYSVALKYLSKNLAKNKAILNELVDENQIIGDALFDSCLEFTWGKKITNAVRDFIIEHSRNSILHGKGDLVEIEIDYNKITIIDNGTPFNPNELLLLDDEARNGGKNSYKFLIDNYNSELIISTRRENEKNIVVLSMINSPEEISDVTPCSIEISLTEFRWGVNEYSIHESCGEIFVVLPKYFTLSDFPRKGQSDALLNETRPITFIGENLSDMIIESIKTKYPSSSIIHIE
jgi:hypothetical protein